MQQRPPDTQENFHPESAIGADDLNPAQFEAVTCVDGPVLVIAGAGTGKTRTLVYRLVHLVEMGVAPENILLLTFTRKAAQEMTGRASLLLKGSCRQVTGGTFHAVANLLLRRYGHYLGYAPNFTILDRADAEGIVNLIKGSLELAGSGKRFPSKRVIVNIISGSVNKSLPFDELVASQYEHLLEHLEDLGRIREAYHSFKRTHGLMDYDDLLVNFRDLLRDHEEVRRELSARFRYVMVDEYQDTNRIQAEIVRLIAADHNNVMVVGDDSQSIYSFRGADFRNIMDFPKIFAGTRIIQLEENYRSTRPILETTNAIIAGAREKYPKNLFTSIEGGDKPVLYGARDEGEQARYVVDKIEKLHLEGVPYHDMAVLFRSGFHSYKLEMELNSRHIRFEKRGGLKLTESAHIKDVLSYLRLVANIRDSLSWNRILLHLPKVGPKTARRIVSEIREAEDPMAALQAFPAAKSWRQPFRALVDLLTTLMEPAPPLALFERVMEYYRPIFELLYHDDFPRRSPDLDQLKTLIGEYADLQGFLDDTTLDPPEAALDLFAEPERDTLVLSTIHSAKGLEWETVFVIHLAEGKFPNVHATFMPEQMEEERRLFYVAATRAKSRLFLSYPRETMAPDRSRHFCTLSPFLLEIPNELMAREGGNRFAGLTHPARGSFTSEPLHSGPPQKPTGPSSPENGHEPGTPVTTTDMVGPGTQVHHNFFGVGQVRRIQGEKTVDVFFPRHGLKTLRLDYAKLTLSQS